MHAIFPAVVIGLMAGIVWSQDATDKEMKQLAVMGNHHLVLRAESRTVI